MEPPCPKLADADQRKDPRSCFPLKPSSFLFVCFVAVVCLIASVRILREYERAVVFTLGRFQKVKGPGPRPADSLHSGDGAGGPAHSGH